jgi:hypothetical protein
LVAQVWTAVLLGIAAIGAGAGIMAPLARRVPMPTATRIALIGAGGLAFIGIATLIVGHFRLLGPWLPYGLAASGAVWWVLARSEFTATVTRGWRGVLTQFRMHPVALSAVSLGLAIATVATVVPPARQDEVDYHWPAPLDWAAAGEWTDSPFKHVDGFPLMEIIYTAAATQGSYVAAHLLHFGAFLTLGFAVAGIATSMDIKGTGVTAAAALAMPVVWDSSYSAYNDIPVAAFAAVGAAVVLASPATSVRAAVLAGVLVAFSASVKPTGAAAVGVLALIVLMRFVTERSAARQAGAPAATWWLIPRQWLLLSLPSAVALMFWSARQYVFTGHFIDPTRFDEPSADALSRLPSDLQQLLAPLLPFVSGVIGSSEPWGGRTAVVIQLLLIPAIVYVLWRRGTVLQRFALMVVPAWAHWVVLGFAIVRTRFHILSWVMFVVGIRIAVEDFVSRYPRSRLWVESIWTLCILAGMIDVSFEMYRHLRLLWMPEGAS